MTSDSSSSFKDYQPRRHCSTASRHSKGISFYTGFSDEHIEPENISCCNI
jgi:hypothetical protein